ncbi:MAG: RMD1 family protein [Gammaproteobacteria bacterium]|nr:RMD1 family protein [Gammaproteobacteria bacterium]MDH5728656.1 RMD1 family protein [Gammaproteobacteria bacterium]
MAVTQEIYSRCYCAQYDFVELQNYLLKNERSVAYRNVLQVELSVGDVFVFHYGVLVFWKVSLQERELFQQKTAVYELETLESIIADEFSFDLNKEKLQIKNDHVDLIDDELLTRLAISHGIAQSTKLAQFESRVQQTINDNSHIPRNIAQTGDTRLSRKNLAQLRGRLFITKSDIVLNYDLLDVPEFFWEYPELQHYYDAIADYLEVKQRVEVLNKKLETIHELFEMMADEQKHKHSSLLEWIIIWLIAFEILVFLVYDVFEVF